MPKSHLNPFGSLNFFNFLPPLLYNFPMLARKLLIGFWLPLLLACALLPNSAPTPAPTAILLLPTVVPASTPNTATDSPPPAENSPTASLAVPTPPLPTPQRTTYRLTATLDYPNRSLTVHQTVRYVNDGAQPLEHLLLLVDGNRAPAVTHLSQAVWEDGKAIENAILEGTQLSLPLPSPLPPNGVVAFQLQYTLYLPPRAGTLGFWRQTNFADWYPFVAARDAQGAWIVDFPGAVGEFLTYPLADFDVTLHIPANEPPLIVAAPANAELSAENSLHYTHTAARTFAWSVSPDYLVLREEKDGVQYESFYFSGYENAARAALVANQQAIALFSELYSPYQHNHLTVVIADFGDGMETDGLYWLGESYYQTYGDNQLNYLTMIAAHETAHNWWFGQVGNNPAQEPWLDEMLCLYSEKLFYERYYPTSADWWWRFRIERHSPSGFANSTIYDFLDFRPYVNAVYLRSAMFWDASRKQMGDEPFFAFLKAYNAQFSGQIATRESFFALLSQYGWSEANQEGYFR